MENTRGNKVIEYNYPSLYTFICKSCHRSFQSERGLHIHMNRMGCKTPIRDEIFTAIPIIQSRQHFELINEEQKKQIRENQSEIQHTRMVLDTLEILFHPHIEKIDFNQKTLDEYLYEAIYY